MGVDALDNVDRAAGERIQAQENNATPPSTQVAITHQISHVRNMPVEMWQKIACNLDYESYNVLRCVSKQISGVLPLATLYNRVSDKTVTLTEDTREDYMKCLSQHSLLTLLTSFSPRSRELLSRINVYSLNRFCQPDDNIFGMTILSERVANKDEGWVTGLLDGFTRSLYTIMSDAFFGLEVTLVSSNDGLQDDVNENSRDQQEAKNSVLNANTLLFAFSTSTFHAELPDVNSAKANQDDHAIKPHLYKFFDCLQRYVLTVEGREKILMQIIGHKFYNFCLENSQDALPRRNMALALKDFSAFFSDCARIDRMVNYVVNASQLTPLSVPGQG